MASRMRWRAGRWGCPGPGFTSRRTAAAAAGARRERLQAEVARLFAVHDGKYGSPRITADLRDAGWRVSENTVAALMREQHLAARRKKRRNPRPGRGRAAGGRRTW